MKRKPIISEKSQPELLRIHRIVIDKLFYRYDHEIRLNVEDRVTILHGPNGIGKTTILKLLAALFGGRYLELAKIPFVRFRIYLSDESVLTVEQTKVNEGEARLESKIKLTLNATGKKAPAPFDFSVNDTDLYELVLKLASEVSWLLRVNEERWLDQRVGDEVSHEEIYNRYGSLLNSRRRKSSNPEPAWLLEFRKCLQIHVIETQRLMRITQGESYRYPGRETTFTTTVRAYAKDLQSRVKESLSRYGVTSQALDQSFPQRLLGFSKDSALPTEKLKESIRAIETKRMKLAEIGLLDTSTESPFDPSKLDLSQRSVMSLYVKDTKKKLDELENLAQSIRLFLNNLNHKFLDKTIQIKRESGFVVIGDDGNAIELDSLSSGEQHELVLLYDLLFKVNPNTLVLIDEPELSLHVLWQEKFMPDLLEIVKVANFDTLVATHSPYIVNAYDHLMVSLSGIETK